MQARVIWATPDAEGHLGYIARVSNPDNQDNPSVSQLIRYLIDHGHWSPFEMVNLCVEIECPRDIARQILRHRSFTFQEFSQRYQTVDKLPPVAPREARLQDKKNRQNSLPCTDAETLQLWHDTQAWLQNEAANAYQWAIQNGIAKECARVVLPEGLTQSRMYINGTLRSWLHYVNVRMDPSTQKEHRQIATSVWNLLWTSFPHTMEAFDR